MTGPRIRAAIALLAVFALGVVAGIWFERHHSASGPWPMTPMTAAEQHRAAMAELREVLDLDDEQVEQIHAILAERQEVVEKMWELLRPEVQREMRDVHEEIVEILRPEQRERFHDWLLRQREQRPDRDSHP